MTVHASDPASSGPRRALLIGCALGALCAAAGQLDAQAFNANPKTFAGAVTYDRATPGVETVTIDSPSAIINWTLPSIPATFLPAGNTATFVNGAGVNDYAVLNRIQSTEPVRFDGHVLGLIGDLAAGTAAPGGTIVFASPGGIIIGASAVFDVGNLVLTSLNVPDDGAGNFYDPASQGLLFTPVGGAPQTVGVQTEPGGQINAPGQGSFVAMVSPLIVHGGAIRVNGSAAFVAGDQVQLRVNQGLFDIIVDSGTGAATPLAHTGSTGGPASTGAGDRHGIYMVAVPKNQAITAILQGNVGFDPAVGVAIENGAIVLSAGFNTALGQVDRYGDFVPVPKVGDGASFEIRGGTIRSDLFGYAVTDMLASGQATGSLAFLQDVSLFAGRRAHLFAGAGQNVTVAGNAIVSAARVRTADPSIFDLTGGEALIFAQGGSLAIAGTAMVDASGRGRVDVATSRAGNGTGGTAGIFAENGSVQIVGATTLASTGDGGTLDFVPDLGGDGTGGKTFVEGRSAGTVQVGGSLAIDASGTGSRENGLGPVPVTGAPGTGGAISVSAIGGGGVTITGTTTLTGTGTGGNVLNGPGNAGGTGQGGAISVLAGGTVILNGAATMSANGQGGSGPNGGAANGGGILVEANAGQVDFRGGVILATDAAGGAGGFVSGGTGGGATGGNVFVRARSGAAAARVTGGPVSISAQGTGGVGANGVLGTPAGRGGDGRGGNVDLIAEAGNGTIRFGAAEAVANGGGGQGGAADVDGDGGRGGDGFGGSIRAGTVDGAAGSQLTGDAQFASLALGASGAGGTGGTGSGDGGNATGGAASLLAAGTPATVGPAAMNANAGGGPGGAPIGGGTAPGATGVGDGGTILIAATAFGGAGGTLTAGNVIGAASATGIAPTGNSPGEWHVAAVGASAINLAGLDLTAAANGPPLALPFSSLEPRGGIITVTNVGMLSTPGQIRVSAEAGGGYLGATLTMNAGGDVTMTHIVPAPGAVTIAVTDLNVTAGDDVSAAAGVVTRSANRTDVRAADLATVGGQMLGRDLQIASADIEITGALGNAGTQLVTLQVNPTTQAATLGGGVQGPGYTLANAEAGRIRADALRLNVPALGTAPALFIRDVTFNGGGAAAGIGTLAIATPGIVRAEGNLLMANARAADGIAINATQRLEVATPAGSIRVRDGAGAPAGTLALFSNNLWVASQAVIDQLRLDPAYAARDADLLANNGVVEPRGYVEADGVALRTGGTLFVQNSGAPFSPAFGGVTVGAGGLIVRGPDAGAGVVTAFGRRRNPDGSFAIGAPFFFEVDFQTPGVPLATSYAAASTFNTCIIVTGQCGGGLVDTGPGGEDPITGPLGGSSAITLPGAAEDEDLVDTSFANDPLIEEPVTSGGESTLWDCDDDNDGDCDD